MDSDGSNQQRLTTSDTARHFYPSLAPDGQSVLFSSNMDKTNFYIYELKLTGELINLWQPGVAPEVSPDGRLIAFAQSDGTNNMIWVMARDGTNPRLLYSNGWDPTWSPDGQKILFASQVEGLSQLMTINLDGLSAVHVNLAGSGIRIRFHTILDIHQSAVADFPHRMTGRAIKQTQSTGRTGIVQIQSARPSRAGKSRLHGFNAGQVDALWAMQTPKAEFFRRTTANTLRFIEQYLGQRALFEADFLAVAAAIEPGIVRKAENKFVEVELHGQHSRGQTVVDWRGVNGKAPNVELVLELDMARLWELFQMSLK